MITGELKSKIDKIWDTIWTGGITSPTTTLEQITYLMFMKLLDDNEIKKEGNAAALGYLKTVSFQLMTTVICLFPIVSSDGVDLKTRNQL